MKELFHLSPTARGQRAAPWPAARLLGCLLVCVLAGCGGGARNVGARVADAERARAGLLTSDVQALAPQAVAEADQALRAAREADAAGDATAAELHAERAVAAYQHAIAIARLARATGEEAQARDALGRAVELAQRTSAARIAAERETADLDKQLKIAREASLPATSGPVDAERERARLVAAQSLATQARLLCSAARLVSPQAPGLAEAEAAASDLEKKLEASPKPAPIDAAGRVRAACLTALTKARRAGGEGGGDQADALLGELSRAKLAEAAPSRDERGVVVTLRSLFKATGLSREGETTLKELGRIASAHPGFAVQVVVHDATTPNADHAQTDRKRGEATLAALRSGGATRTQLEVAGARAPVIDPTDAKRREKNARVEIVFVGD